MATKRACTILNAVMMRIEKSALDYLYDNDFCWLWGAVRLAGREEDNASILQIALALYDAACFIHPALVSGINRYEITQEPENDTYVKYRMMFAEGLKKSLRKNPR